MLGPWGKKGLEHWKKHRPKMYRELEKSGKLMPILEALEERAGQLFASLVADGWDAWEAEEHAMREYLLLPTEEDMPELGVNPDQYLESILAENAKWEAENAPEK